MTDGRRSTGGAERTVDDHLTAHSSFPWPRRSPPGKPPCQWAHKRVSRGWRHRDAPLAWGQAGASPVTRLLVAAVRAARRICAAEGEACAAQARVQRSPQGRAAART
eukprot:4085485-Prymnesium_polylepis.1